jgi:DNA-binding transcriptional MocR family regulator
MTTTDEPLYLSVAEELAGLIAGGQLRPLERVPSVRVLARQKRISMTTAVASLRSLEARGLIEVRPQSGYYVAPRRIRLAEPQAARVSRAVRQVGAKAMLARLSEASQDPEVAHLGPAVADGALFPQRALQRELTRVLRRTPRLLSGYEIDVAGSATLRHEIVRHYAHVGAGLQQEELLITNGCTEALNLALGAVAGAGDAIAVESPTYFGFLQILESRGIKVVEIPVQPGEGLSIEALADLLGSRAGRAVKACLVIGNFSNPSGAALSDARKRSLVRLCRDAGIALVEDDVYGDLQHAGPRPLPCKAFDREGGVILCSSFSKSLAPGSRVGYIAGGRYRDAIKDAKYSVSLATAPLQQEMIAGYLRSGRYERHLQRLRRAFAAQLAQLAGLVEEHFPAGTRLSRPRGGCVLWVELPGDVDTTELYDRARRAGVAFVPGALFSASGRFGNCLRLNAGQALTPQMQGAVARLGVLAKRSG